MDPNPTPQPAAVEAVANDLFAMMGGGQPGELAQEPTPVPDIVVPAPPAPPAASPTASDAASAAPDAGVAPPVAPAPPPAPEVPADPLDLLLNGVEEETPWPEDILGRFKNDLGFDNPGALKQHLTTLNVEVESLRGKAREAELIKSKIDEFPLELQNAIDRQMRGEDGVGYLQGLKGGVTLSREAKDIASDKLVDAYFPGKFTQDHMDAIAAGDEAMKAAHDRFAELAAIEHDKQRNQELGRIKLQQDASDLRRNAFDSSRTAAIAHLKNDKALSGLVDNAFIEKFSQGKLEAELLYNEDGSYRPEAAARLAMIALHPKLVERLRAGARTEARNEALLETTARLPNTAKPGPAERIPPPALTQEQQRTQSVEQGLFDAMGRR